MNYQFPTGLDVIEDGSHPLLESATPAFSSSTIRRAFVVWLYCGQQNHFQDVCNYYHRLEALENTMSPSQRAASRQLEHTLFSNQPPTSSYLRRHFPNLYTQTHIEGHYMRRIEAIRNESLFDLETFNGLDDGTKQAIVDASQVIKKYCIEQSIPLREFLIEFKEYTERCELKNTISNMERYIKRKTIQLELQIVGTYAHEASLIKARRAQQNNKNVRVDKNENKSTVNKSEKINNGVKVQNTNDDFDFHNLTVSDIHDEPSHSVEAEIDRDKNQMKLLTGVSIKPESSHVTEMPNKNKDKETNISLTDFEDSFKSIEASDLGNMSSATDIPSDISYKTIENVDSVQATKRDGNNDVCSIIIDELTDLPYEKPETLKYREI